MIREQEEEAGKERKQQREERESKALQQQEEEEDEGLPQLQRIGWTEYGSVVDALVEKVKQISPTFDVVVGIARGGLPLAVTISNQMGKPMQAIDITSYAVVGKKKVASLRPSLLDVKGKRVLLVDDLVDTGDTLEMAFDHLKGLGAGSIVTAVLFNKPRSKIRPDFWVSETTNWIVFPYERKVE
jgi:hypoxanthine phosphoribosyltransferase